MKIISWNVRGAKKAQVLQEILFLKRMYQPQMIFLLETLVNKTNILQILPKMGFDHFDYVEPVNHSGGLAVLWNNDFIHASILRKESRAIHMLVFDTLKQTNVIISGVYGPAQIMDKDEFWTSLSQMNTVVDLPWCIIGDLNELAAPSEKKGGLNHSLAKYERLNRFLAHINAISVPSKGQAFTWKNRLHSHLIYERLDRAIVRNDWLQLYPDTIVCHGTFSCSDHCPIVLSDRDLIPRRKKFPFRFQNYWCHYRQLDPIIGRQWQTTFSGTHMFKIAQKLKLTKKHVRVWASQTIGNQHQKLLRNAQKLTLVEDKLLSHPDSIRLNAWMNRLLQQREKLMLFNQKYWGNFRRKEWLVHGDRNSRFFQQQANTRRKKKLIYRLQTDCGIWLDTPQDIALKFIQDYSTRFQASLRPSDTMSVPGLCKAITHSENIQLTKIPNLAEIKRALFAIDSSKTPGPDGFGAGFFKHYWKEIHVDFSNSIMEFFRSGKLLKQLNHTFIALIPKRDNPVDTQHFRPISLCNTIYKTISKIMVNRLRPLLQKLVSPVQSAFIPGRSIHENILLTHEIMHKFRKSKGKKAWVALKLDMEKAYDRLEWPFIRACLQQLGFHDIWTNWIMECITTVSYSLLINDESTGLITPTRGIRQGDPLSPYIFILCMEALSSALLREATLPKSGLGIKLSAGLDRIPCLLFADDCLLFCQADNTHCLRLKQLLDTFCSNSGQLINYHKSSLTFSANATGHHRRLVAGIFSITQTESLGKYLGCPVFQKRPTAATYHDLIDKTMTKLAGWKANCLSKAGRSVLIQSHLESLPAHTMQCFQLPLSVTTKVDRLNREFFWKKNNSEQGLPMVAWDKVCTPKNLGGLGLRKMAAVNCAFQCKLAWKILAGKDSLWTSVMRAKYLRGHPFLAASAKPGDSTVWRTLTKCQDLIRQGMVWTIGDGKDISFWKDNWLDTKSLSDLVDLRAHHVLDENIRVSEFIANRNWNVTKLQIIIQQPAIIQKILGIPIPLVDTRDSYCWGLSSTGEFTTRSAIWLAHGVETDACPWPFKWLWKIDTMPKIKVFLWQLCHNALPVKGILFRRGCRLDPLCPLCLKDIETLEHLFSTCSITLRVWHLARQHHWVKDLALLSQSRDWVLAFQQLASVASKHMLQRFSFLLWSIWKARNASIFQNETFQPMRCLIRAKKLSAEWRIRTRMSVDNYSPGFPSIPTTHLTSQIKIIRWHPPNPGRMKLNFDGSLQGTSAAGGFIIRDWQGAVLLIGACNYGTTTVAMAESRALRDGLQAAIRAGYSALDVEGDNSLVVAAVTTSIGIPWRVKTVIHDIQQLLLKVPDSRLTHVYREANLAADLLSKLGHSTSGIWTNVADCSVELSLIVNADRIGRSLMRRAA